MTDERAANSRGYDAVVVCGVWTAIAGVFVAIRCYARFGIVRKAGPEDVLILLSLLTSIALTVAIWAQAQHGLGRHFNTLLPGEYASTLRPMWISIMMYNFSLTLTKISILLQFLRFFVEPMARRACWVALGVVVAYGLETFLTGTLTCLPVQYFWDRSVKGGRCVNLMALWFTNASLEILTDILVCVLPIPVLKDLHLPTRQKYGLLLVFSVGGFGCITSILRLHSTYVAAHSTDITWDNVGAARWSSIEVNVGIICACLPTLKPVATRFIPWLVRSNNSTSETGNGNDGSRRRRWQQRWQRRRQTIPSEQSSLHWPSSSDKTLTEDAELGGGGRGAGAEAESKELEDWLASRGLGKLHPVRECEVSDVDDDDDNSSNSREKGREKTEKDSISVKAGAVTSTTVSATTTNCESV